MSPTRKNAKDTGSAERSKGLDGAIREQLLEAFAQVVARDVLVSLGRATDVAVDARQGAAPEDGRGLE